MSDSTTPLGPNPSGLCMCGCGQPTRIASHDRHERGDVRGQHVRFIHGHNRRVDDRSYTVDDNGCWNWNGHIGSRGYGRVWQDARFVMAHRWMYEREVGAIPESMVLDHICRNRRCVNPAHLEPVTIAENCRRGNQVVLTAADIRAIRAAKAAGGRNIDIAAQYGISGNHVCDIIARRRWGHVV